MGADHRGRSVRKLTDTVSRPAEPESNFRQSLAVRRRPARAGRHRVQRRRRPRTIPTERTLPDTAGTTAPSGGVGSMLSGRYRLERVLGDGGSATVYGGTDTVLERTVAVKVFHAGSDATAQARREREIHLASEFVHPHLVAVYDAHHCAETDQPCATPPYLVCEYVNGPSLARRLNRGPLPADEAAAIGIDVAQALAVLHTAGVVHRDVKPGNVLLDTDTGRAKLSDLGIARDLSADPVTRTSDVVGTAPYLSPEQARGGTVGCPSDIYSLGLVLLECLTGRREYDGEPIPAAVARLIRDPHVPADLPAPWPTLLRRMTRPDPDQRPTADEIAVILAHRAHPATTAAPPANTSGRRVPPGPASTTAAARRRGWLLAAAAGAALLITAAVGRGVDGPDPAADPPAAASTPSTTHQPATSWPPTNPPPAPPAPAAVTPTVAAPPPAAPASPTEAQPVPITDPARAAEPAPAATEATAPSPGDTPEPPSNAPAAGADPAVPGPVDQQPTPADQPHHADPAADPAATDTKPKNNHHGKGKGHSDG